MTPKSEEKRLYGDDIQIAQRTDRFTQYKIIDETGEGTMTAYDVSPGIRLFYNDMNMEQCMVKASPPENFIEINHCKEGQIELLFDSGEYLYLTKGDLSIHLKSTACRRSVFPLSHYYGIGIEMDMTRAPTCLSCILDDVSIDFGKLMGILSQQREQCIILRNMPSFDHIFSELYSISDDMRVGYYKIKILEIMFFLCGLDLHNENIARKYYSKFQVQTVKAIKQHLDTNWANHITLGALSEKFHMPMTTMKKCFHGVFDTSIYTYLRHVRMQNAAMLLIETEETVLSIAGRVGYDNASKFSAAFRAVMGQLPTDYRRTNLKKELQA